MFARWNKVTRSFSTIRSVCDEFSSGKDIIVASRRNWSSKATATTVSPNNVTNSADIRPTVNLEKYFWAKPCSLALPLDSPDRIEQPQFTGIKRLILKMMLYYSNQSKAIRGANVVYHRIVSQVDKRPIYEVFNLEPTFKMKFSLLVLHTWLFLRRIKQEGEEGVEFGQYLYEIYNHDVELRVSKAGVNLLLTKWMKELEKIFYGNIIAYDTALLPESKQDDLQNVLWRNVLSDDGVLDPDATALRTLQAMARYVRRENACLSLTDKEALITGNFKFSSLVNS